MQHIIKVVIILVIELNIYICLGSGMKKIRIFPEQTSLMGSFLNGFFIYHFLFWCIAFPCNLLDYTLVFLVRAWGTVIIALLVFIAFLSRSEIIQTYKQMLHVFWKYKYYMISCLIVQAILIYYVCLNGQLDVDARTYLGEVTMMVDTNRLVGFAPTTGMPISNIAVKTGFTMFGANSAVLCVLFQIHPLIFCRTVRAAINVIMLAAVLLEIFRWVYRRKENAMVHAMMALMLSQSFLFLFANSIYTSSSFILKRAYEGKAYCSGVLVLYALYLSIKLCEMKDKRYFVLMFIGMIASISISASAAMVPPLMIGSVVGAYIFVERKWSYIPRLLAALSPNIIYIILCFSGFAGFALEG